MARSDILVDDVNLVWMYMAIRDEGPSPEVYIGVPCWEAHWGQCRLADVNNHHPVEGFRMYFRQHHHHGCALLMDGCQTGPGHIQALSWRLPHPLHKVVSG